MGTISSPLLVGRDQELALLEGSLAHVLGGEAAIVVIGGDAGVGKSRLVEAFAARAKEGGGRVLVGGCLNVGHGGLPFGPFVEALRGLVREIAGERLSEVLGPAREEVVRLIPDLDGEGLRPQPLASADAGGLAAARLFELLLGLFDRLAREAPVILVLEDIHWIDAASRDLLTFLARNLTSERVLIVATYRAEELERGHPLLAYLAELERNRRVERLILGPLRVEETERQLAAILGRAPARDLVRQIHGRSEGNPFFVEELAAASNESGDGTELPASLAETLRVRLAGLSRPAERLLQVAAVAGRDVDERLLEQVAELDEGDLIQGLGELRDRQILISHDRGADGPVGVPLPPNQAYRFRHALLREVAYEDLVRRQRRALHGRLAATLAGHPELADPSPAAASGELAHHWAAADQPVEALSASIEAARAAEAVHAHDQAERHYERALRLWEQVPDGLRPSAVDEVGLRAAAAEAANMSGHFERAVHNAEAAVAGLDPNREPARAGALLGRVGYFRWLTGASEPALEAHRRAVTLVPATPPSVERARVLAGLCGALMGAGHYRESKIVCEDALVASRAANAPNEEARALNMLGSDLVSLGELEPGLQRLREARELARAAGRPDALVIAYHNLGLNLQRADAFPEALEQLLEGIEVARQHGLDRRYGVSLRAAAADVHFRNGDWTRADQLTSEALRLGAEGTSASYPLGVRGRLIGHRGEFEAGLQLLAVALEHAVDPDMLVYLLIARAELAAWQERSADVLREVERGVRASAESDDELLAAPLCAVGMRAAVDRVEAARALRRADASSAATDELAKLDDLGSRLRSTAEERSAPSRTASCWLDQSLAERSRLESPPVAEPWAALAERWRVMAVPFQAAYAELRQAEALLRAGAPRREVQKPLKASIEGASRLGAMPLASLGQELARRARIAVEIDPAGPAGPRSGPISQGASKDPRVGGGRNELGLSPRELEVLVLIAQGRTNAQIASELFISPKTAGVHVTHILDKLGVSNRVEAAMIASRLGLTGASRKDSGETEVVRPR